MSKKSTSFSQRFSFFRKISAWEYVFQFLMLFLAVTAGFFAKNIREERSQQNQSREYARTMVKELAKDTMNIRFHINLINKVITDVDTLAAFVKNTPADKMTNVDLYRLTRIQSNPPFRWSLATLDQIKSSGQLQYFTNDSIVLYISNYSAWTQHLDLDNSEDRQSYRYATQLTNHIVNRNYTAREINAITSQSDTILNANGKFNQPLLSHDTNEITEMVNAYLTARDLSEGHLHELSAVSKDQGRLIKLLKREYNLK